MDASQDSGRLSNDHTDSMAAFFGGEHKTETECLEGLILVEEFEVSVEWKQW